MKKNNKPAWYETTRKSINENNCNVIGITPTTEDSLQERKQEIREQNKELLDEFRLRTKNSFAHLCVINPDKEIVKSIIGAFYDSISASQLFAEISEYNAPLFFELNQIFHEEYHNACKHIGEGYLEDKFL